MAIPRNLGAFADNVDTNGNLPVTGIAGTGSTAGQVLTSQGSGAAPTWTTLASSQWTTSGSNISYTAGQVQIGTGTAAAPALSVASDTNTGMFFPAADTIAFAEGGTESMRLDSLGRLSIGTTTASQLLNVRAGAGASGGAEFAGNANTIGTTSLFVGQGSDSTGFVYQRANAALTFGTNGTEQMRITSQGLFGFGTSSPSSNYRIDSFGGARFYHTNANTSIDVGRQGDVIYYNDIKIWSGYNGTYPTHQWTQGFTGALWQLGLALNITFPTGGGGVGLNYNGTSWYSLSDVRLKDVTGGLENPLDAVAQLQAIRFTWKYDEGKKPCIGLSAQSVAAVLPEAIEKAFNPVDKEDKTEYMAVKYTEVIPLLTAAIQELKNELDMVKSELAALKTNS